MNEKLAQRQETPSFDKEKSPAREAYMILNANSPAELNTLYTDQDQMIFKSGAWDYHNPDLVINKIKNILETINLKELSEEEAEWAQEILWFWYHHAISCAIWKYKDRQAAKMYASKALEIQTEDSPNKITRLLALLVDDKIEEAEKWVEQITEEPEKTSARELLQEYKEGKFF